MRSWRLLGWYASYGRICLAAYLGDRSRGRVELAALLRDDRPGKALVRDNGCLLGARSEDATLVSVLQTGLE